MLKFESKTIIAEFTITGGGDTWECSCDAEICGTDYSGQLPDTRQESKLEAFIVIRDSMLRFIGSLPKKPSKADIGKFETWADEQIELLAQDLDVLSKHVSKALAEGDAVKQAAETDAMQKDIKTKTEELAEKTAERIEREDNIAGASRLDGQIGGFFISSKFSDLSAQLCLKKMKDEKQYRHLKGRETWPKYCDSIGISVRKADELIENLDIFGEEFLALCADFGIGTANKRLLRAAAKDGTLAITDHSIIIDVVVEDVIESEEPEKLEIPYKDKDELRQVLSDVIAKKNEELKAAKESLKDKEHFINTKDEQMSKLSQTNRKLEKQLKIYTDGGEINGMPVDDVPVYEKLKVAQLAGTELFSHIMQIANELETLSEANQHYLGGTIYYLHDLTAKLCSAIGVRGVAADKILNAPDGIDPLKNALIPGLQMAAGHKA